MRGWAAPETDLLSETGLSEDSNASDRAVKSYCLPPSLSSYEVAERALRHAVKFLGEESKALDWELSDDGVLDVLSMGDQSRPSASVTHQETRYAGHQPEPAHHKQ
jgi:hypothetical protein